MNEHSKMQRMFQDMSFSQIFNDQYREHCQKHYLTEISMENIYLHGVLKLFFSSISRP